MGVQVGDPVGRLSRRWHILHCLQIFDAELNYIISIMSSHGSVWSAIQYDCVKWQLEYMGVKTSQLKNSIDLLN